MSRVGMSTLLLSPLVHPTPTWDTTGYGRQAGGPHPSGMRFCFCYFFSFLFAVKKRSCNDAEYFGGFSIS